jgi:hypothetical protein
MMKWQVLAAVYGRTRLEAEGVQSQQKGLKPLTTLEGQTWSCLVDEMKHLGWWSLQEVLLQGLLGVWRMWLRWHRIWHRRRAARHTRLRQ